MSFTPLFLLFLCLISNDVYAGAAVQRQQQMKQAQEQAQHQAIQQAVAQRQQEEMAKYQAAQYQAAQYRAAQEAQIQIVRQQMMERAVQQQINAQIAAYIQNAQINAAQEAIVRRELEIQMARRYAAMAQQKMTEEIRDRIVAESVIAAVQKAKMENAAAEIGQVQTAVAAQQVQAVQQAQAYEMMQQAQGQAILAAGARPYQDMAYDQVEDIVDIAQIWNSMANNSKAWALMIDEQAKVQTVNEFIERFRKEGIRIQKPPYDYVRMIDDMSLQNPDMLRSPFRQVIQMIAVMEYDFDNGVDRDELARKLLGPKMFVENRRRLGK